MAVPTGTYLAFPALRTALSPLMRKERGYARRIAAVQSTVEKLKKNHAELDALLLLAGLKKSELVTWGPWDVRHNERAGQVSHDMVGLAVDLVAEGVPLERVKAIFKAREETGKPALFVTVTRTKGL